MAISLNVPRNWLLSPWTVVLIVGSTLSLAAWSFGLWKLLDAIHPWGLACLAVGLTLWLLFALSPKMILHVMRVIDITLPRGDSGVPFMGLLVRSGLVLLGPTFVYISLMYLREGASVAAEIVAAVFLGAVLGAVSYRSVTLINIMRVPYVEDEIRKGILDTGVYGEIAIKKLEEAVKEILEEPNLDKKRIRLRRLAATDRVLRNKNYDPHQIEHGTTTAGTEAGYERERRVAWAKRTRERIGRQADLEDAKLDAEIAEAEERRRRFDEGPT